MKKTLSVIAVLSILAGSIISTQAVTQGNEKERGYISISTNADTEVAPDVAEISFAVKTSDTKSMQKASLMNKDISEKINNIMKDLINTSNGDYIKTSNYNASPVYIYDNNKKKFDKYEVSNRIIVHTKSLDKLGSMIDKATEAGATNVDSLNFSVSNYETQCNSLIEIASKKAITRANIAAKSSGSALDGIRSMDISCSENASHSTPRYYMAKNMLSSVADGAAAQETSTSISSGVIKVYANVNASFFVK
jgi:hypothetical protein